MRFDFSEPATGRGSLCNTGELLTERIPDSPLKLELKETRSGEIEVTEDRVSLDQLKRILGRFRFLSKRIRSIDVALGSLNIGLFF